MVRRVRQQQMVKRGVGEHHAEVTRVRRDRRRDLGAGAPARRSRSGARGPRAAPPRRRSARRAPVRPARLGRHQRERLVLAMLARAQRADGRLVVGATGQMKAAQALDARILPIPIWLRPPRCGSRCPSSGIGSPPPGSMSRTRGPHAGTRSAGRGSGGRAGPRTRPGTRAHISNEAMVVRAAVVRDAADDREPGTAIGAVDERIAVAAVGGIEQLGQAVGTGGRVRGDERLRLAAALGLDDPELALSGRRARPRRLRPPRPRAAARPPGGEPGTRRSRSGLPRPRAGPRARH